MKILNLWTLQIVFISFFTLKDFFSQHIYSLWLPLQSALMTHVVTQDEDFCKKFVRILGRVFIYSDLQALVLGSVEVSGE